MVNTGHNNNNNNNNKEIQTLNWITTHLVHFFFFRIFIFLRKCNELSELVIFYLVGQMLKMAFYDVMKAIELHFISISIDGSRHGTQNA